MKPMISVVIMLVFLCFGTQAQAHPRRHVHPMVVGLGVGLIHMLRTADSGLSAPCRQAAREGGPCGCWAAEHLLGTSEHVWHGVNVWMASDWLRFRHVNPGPGTAAVMHHHVVPVLADNGATVTVNDSWGVHEVSKRAVIAFVQPGDGGDNYSVALHYARREKGTRYAMADAAPSRSFGMW